MQEFDVMKKLVQRATGRYIETGNEYVLENALKPLLDSYDCENYDQLASLAQGGTRPELLNAIVDAVTNNETRFFREPSNFDALVEQIIPEWLERNGTAKPLKICSAACSTGQEPYSISMLIAQKLPHVHANLSITAYDISHAALASARQALYTKFEISRGVPPEYVSYYFNEIESKFSVKGFIKERVVFKNHDLLRAPLDERFDIIFCRNLSIYFKPEDKKRLFANLTSALNPDGVFILGLSESLRGFSDNYVLRQFGMVKYYELKPSNVVMF